MSSIEFCIDRRIESKPRAIPVLVREGDFRTLGTFADPSVRLVESYIRAKAREAVLHYETQAQTTWTMTSQYAVSIELGPTVSGRSADVDNLAKTVMDGMTEAVYDRDSRVSSLQVTREERPSWLATVWGGNAKACLGTVVRVTRIGD